MLFYHPEPAPYHEGTRKLTPQANANWFSQLTFGWFTPMIKVGYSRPLEMSDMWRLKDDRSTERLTRALQHHFFDGYPAVPVIEPAVLARTEKETGQQEKVDRDTEVPQMESSSSTLYEPILGGKRFGNTEANATDRMDEGITAVDPVQTDELVKPAGKASDNLGARRLTYALWKTVRKELIICLIARIINRAILLTSALVLKQLLRYVTDSHSWHNASEGERAGLRQPSSIGTGIGWGLGLFAMTVAAPIAAASYAFNGDSAGCYSAMALVNALAQNSIRLSPRSRLLQTNGKIVSSASVDSAFVNFACPMSAEVLVQPVTVLAGCGLLIYTLGTSALVGVAVLVLSSPAMLIMLNRLKDARKAQVFMIDKRVRLLNEILNSVRGIRIYAYERYFAERVLSIREGELGRLKTNIFHRASMIATMAFLPILATILTFITYGLTGHTLDAPTILSAFQVFGVIQAPLQQLPMALAAVSDGFIALGRISAILLSEEVPERIHCDRNLNLAVDIDGAFTYETPVEESARDDSSVPVKEDDEKFLTKVKHAISKRFNHGSKAVKEDVNTGEEKNMYPDDPFRLQEIKLQIPKGAFVAIVGRIGSGKSALLQGIIGSMRQTHGYSHFGGSLSYVAQQSWIQNATLRQNIAFNQEEVDEVRLRRAIAACSLSRDIELLPDGLETEIGEHGINLSGGQKARTALARAVYKNADIVLLDSPLAAVDSHVAADLIENCLLHKDALGSKTRILITHHLEVLPKADMVLVMDKGRIIQQGTYTELLGISGTFRTLVEDHSTGMQAKEDVRIDTRGEKEESEEGDSTTSEEGRAGEPATKLILDEERNVGDVSWAVYIAYARVMSKEWTFAFAMIMLVIDEASSVLNTLFLGYWSGSAISGFRQGDYMGLYAAFGGLQALCSFLGSYTLFLAGVRASYLLFDGALTGVLRSSNSFHDRTPVGRIVSRLTSDIERTDDRLTYAWYGYLSGLLSLVGLMSLVFYTFPPLGALFVPLGLAFGVIGALYRHTSRESKRVSSVAQSFVYSSIGEQLDGMTTIRAFGLERTFQKKIRQTIDAIGSADYVASTCRRWMVVRCEMLSAILLLGIVAFGLGYKNSVDPVKFGVVLTYTLRMGTAFQQTIEAATRTEQEMNATERLLHFTELPREAAPRVDDDPPKEWPQRGQVVFKRVCLQYRPDLPLVLRDISFQAEAGEKIGIVGRTGAGKSSLAQALFRLVELTAGSIYIDGVDLSIIGLDTLRSQLSALPQDTLLFSGTMRENIDPTREKADPELNDTMRRCGLILSDEQIERGVDQERYKKFQLDAIVSDDGSNFSGGERQLVALCRALVKGSKLLLLDEATSSVDAETDATIQKCIRSEFSDVTLLCIAHRLATIAFYDKVLVMDSGQIAEFDNPLILFDRPDSIFRSMCDSAKLTREAIVRIRVGENWEEMERSVVHDHRLGRVDTIRLSGQGD